LSRRRRVKGFYTDESGKIRPLTEYFGKNDEEENVNVVKAKILGDVGKRLNRVLVEGVNARVDVHSGGSGITVYVTVDGKPYELVYHKIDGQWRLVKLDKFIPDPEDEIEGAKLGGRHLVNIAHGQNDRGEEVEAPIYIRNEIRFEKPDPITLEFYKSLPVDETAESWAYASSKEIVTRLNERKEKFKYGSVPVRVKSLELAEKIASALSWVHGGAEIVPLDDKTYVVKSRGYYHYIGA
jgi:hypothetical protein